MKSKNVEYLKEDYLKSNFFKDKFNDDYKLFEIKEVRDLTDIFLKKLHKDLNISCKIDEITNLHTKIDGDLKIYDQKFGVNKISKIFSEMPKSFHYKYIDILKTHVRDIIGQDFFFQLNPTIRVQVPHSSSSAFYPFYHSDIQNGHPPYMINIWIPLNPPSPSEGYGFNLTPLSNSIEIFKNYNFDIFQIQKDRRKIGSSLDSVSTKENFDYGNISLFDSRKIHSTIALKNHVRASMDIRIVPVNIFKKFNRKYESVFGRKLMIFEPGSYYRSQSIDNYKI